MPALPFDQATLQEVLEVRDEPLCEEELWSILLEGGLALKSILSKASHQDRIHHLTLTLRPDTILLCLNGKIKFVITKHVKADKRYIAPEGFLKDPRFKLKDEKMLIYSLGMIVLTASEYRMLSSINYSLNIELESLLCSMVEDNVITRISVSELIQTCSQHLHPSTCYIRIKSMAAEIVGPYGLEPVSLSVGLQKYAMDDNECESYPYSSGLSHLQPVDQLSPVTKPQGKGISLHLYDFESDSDRDFEVMKSGAWDAVDNKILPMPKESLSPRSVNIEKKTFPETPSHEAPHDRDLKQPEIPKAWSPTYSSPDFQVLMDMENKKLQEKGYSREIPKKVSPLKNYKSMPSLNKESSNMVADGHGLHKDSGTRKVLPHHHSTGYLDEGASLHSPTSQYSSQVSLTHGAYVLGDPTHNYWPNEYPLKRFGSGSTISHFSDDGSKFMSMRQPQQYRMIELPHLGPEFIRISSNPETAFIDITPPRLGPLPKGTRQISVILPNTQKVQTNVQVNSKGKDLFDQISSHMNVKETVYFGLTQLKDDEHVFIDLDSKLTKYSPTGWKDENMKKQKSEFVLYFKVKFFVENPSTLRHQLTIHLYYLQLRQDVLQSHTHCPDDVLLTLVAYALQAEYGPFEPEYHNTEYFRLEHFIPGRVLSRMSRMELLRTLALMHQSHNCLSSHEAETGFLEEAKKLPEYGVIFHKVSRSKKIETDIVWLGICIRGIFILEPKGKQRAAVHKQAWNLIKEFNFEKKKFIMKPKNPEEHPKMVFFTNHYRRSKYLFKMCQSFHRFQIFNQSRNAPHKALSCQSSFDGHSHTPNEISKKDSQSSHTNNLLAVQNVDKNVVLVNIRKHSNEGLGITIVGGEDSKRIAQGIFIKHIKPGSVCAKDGRLNEGDKILSVNGHSLDTVYHEEAVDFLRKAGNRVKLMISKASSKGIIFDKSGLSPNLNQSQLSRDNYDEWEHHGRNKQDFDVLQEKFSGFVFVDEESDQYSERCVDVTKDVPAIVKEHISPSAFAASVPSTHDTYRPQDGTPRKNIYVNDVEINDNENSLAVSDESDDGTSEQFHGNLKSTLKRFGNFEELHKLDEVDNASSFKEQRQAVFGGMLNTSDEIVRENRVMDETIEEIDVEIQKKNGSYGLSIIGGCESDLPLGGIYVKSLHANGAAGDSGKIRIGDRILSVNGISLENVSHEQAVKILKHNPRTACMILDRGIEISNEQLQEPSRSPIISKMQSLKLEHPKEHIFEAEIVKGEDGVGLSLVGGKDSDLLYQDKIMIKKLFPGQPMQKSGKFQVGDIILAINDHITEGMTHQEVLSVIRSAAKEIRIIAKRPPENEIPEELFMNSRPVSPEKLMQNFQSRTINIEGRQSREGNRIAKHLLKSMAYNDSDDSTQDLSISPVYTSEDNDDIPKDFTDALPHGERSIPSDQRNIIEGSHVSNEVRDSLSNSFDKLKLPRQPSDKQPMTDSFPVATSSPSSINIQNENYTPLSEDEFADLPKSNFNHLDKIRQRDDIEYSQTDSDSILGKPRHRPYKSLANPAKEENVELTTFTKQNSIGVNVSTLYLVKNEKIHGLILTVVNRQLVVEDVMKGTPADLQQVFQRGLVIKNINGHSVQSFTPEMAYELLDSLAPRIQFTVEENLTPMIKKSIIKNEQHEKFGIQSETAFFSQSPVTTDNMSKDIPSESITSPVLSFHSAPGSPVLKQLDASSYFANKDKHFSRRRLSTSSRSSSNGEIILVQLEKGEKGLGITLGTMKNEDDNSYVYIKRIVPGSVAEENRQLRIGDKLISVNGQSVEDWPQKEVVSLFRKLAGTITIECYRFPDNASPIHKASPSIKPILSLPKPPSSPSKSALPLKIQNEVKESVECVKTSEIETSFTVKTSDSTTALSSTSNEEHSPLVSAAERSVLPTPVTYYKKLRDKKQVLSPIESASTTLEMVDAEKIDYSMEAAQSPFADSDKPAVMPPPPAPVFSDEIGWSSSDEVDSKALDFSLPGMDQDGIIQTSIVSSGFDDSFEFEDSLDKRLQQTDNTLHQENDKNSKIEVHSIQPENLRSSVVLPKPPSTSSLKCTPKTSGIPRLIRSRSNSRSNSDGSISSRSSLRSDCSAPQNVISNDHPAFKRTDDHPPDRFIERKDFVFYSKSRVSKLVKAIDDKMNSMQLNSEFMCLRQVKVGGSTDVAIRACNREKNRNKVVLPYDRNRVELTGGEETDYINASHVKIEMNEKQTNYIVTQAPLRSTVDDFWRCVWENKVELIVMLVKQEEGGKEKCFKYWPNTTGSPKKILDRFEIDLLYEEDNGTFLYRQIQLRNSKMDKSLFITQAAFTQWPDNGVPQDVIDFLGFMKFVRNFQTVSPTLVHCNCGVGRSGIFIIVNSVWNAMEKDTTFDVSAITRSAKEQRQLLIQTKEQYHYCYRLIRELLVDIPH